MEKQDEKSTFTRATRFDNVSPSSSAKSTRIICSGTEKPRNFCVWWHDSRQKLTTWSIPATECIAHSCPCIKFKPSSDFSTPSQDVLIDKFSGEGVRPNDFAGLDLYIMDGEGRRLSQMSPKHSGMLSHAANILFIFKLHNLMEKYGTPFFRVDRITSDLCAIEAASMTLISERATIMCQVSTSAGVISQYPSEVYSPPPLMADNNPTLTATESTWVLKAERVVVGNKERGATEGSSFSITSHS